jgi:hypothetical protein
VLHRLAFTGVSCALVSRVFRRVLDSLWTRRVCSSDSRARGIGTRHTFGGGIVVRSSERHTVVQEDATICHIQWCAPADGFRDIASWETVVESRAVIHVRRSVRLPGKGRIEAQVQRIPLIVVDGAISGRRILRACCLSQEFLERLPIVRFPS